MEWLLYLANDNIKDITRVDPNNKPINKLLIKININFFMSIWSPNIPVIKNVFC